MDTKPRRMKNLKYIFFLWAISYSLFLGAQMSDPPISLSGLVVDDQNLPIPGARISLVGNSNTSVLTDTYGKFSFSRIPSGRQVIIIYSLGFKPITDTILVSRKNPELSYQLRPLSSELEEVEITVQAEPIVERLRAIRGVQLFAAKKNEIIRPDEMVINKGTNNARQLYAKVSGLNIWESDYAGNQLEIGGRGLSPSRTSNFNTRQNGYDISADPLGYPETYYSPPAEAISQIDILRGASSLQFGSQFGGMVNFVLKEKQSDHWIEGESSQTFGSFGLFNSYNALGLQHKNHSLYGFVNYRTSKGWKAYSEAENQTYYLKYKYQLHSNLSISAEYTGNRYLAQQPGGLTDRQFEEDPYQVTRKRNWFRVAWNMPAIELNWKINNNLEISQRTFALIAEREALGFLAAPNLQDPAENSFEDSFRKQRNLISDDFNNIGSETRLLKRAKLAGKDLALTTGLRYYQGKNLKQQGYADEGDAANFNYVSEDFPGISSFDFTNKNAASFAEALLFLNSKWRFTAGLRYEWISTQGQGQYRALQRAPDNSILVDSLVGQDFNNERGFVISGVGISHRIKPSLEVFFNLSQNYRSITFNDAVVQNPSFRVDPQLRDERGYNVDLGIKGLIAKGVAIDVTAFYLRYANRIGLLLATDTNTFAVYRLRTNIGQSNTYGIESLIEVNPMQWLTTESKWQFSAFANTSILSGTYNSDNAAIDGNKIELVPDFTFKAGIKFGYKDLVASVQYSYVNDHFSDATNAFETSNGVSGLIPSYSVWDLGLRYTYKSWKLEGGVNNLFNQIYFTRRATGYPGPGIIPAAVRNMYLGLKYSF